MNGEDVWGIAAAGDTVWVEGQDRLHQFDAATGTELRSIEGSVPWVEGDTLWYQRGTALVAANAATGVEQTAYHPPILGGTLVRNGILWALNKEKGILARVDLKRGTITGTLDLPGGEPKWVDVWEGAVWVVMDGYNIVLRVNPSTLTVTDTIPAGSRPHSVAIARGSMWIIEHGAAEVLRLEPSHGKVIAAVKGPGINVGIAVDGEAVWAATLDGLARIDTATNQVVETIPLPKGEYYGMAVTPGWLWVTTGEDGKGVFQIPLR